MFHQNYIYIYVFKFVLIQSLPQYLLMKRSNIKLQKRLRQTSQPLFPLSEYPLYRAAARNNRTKQHSGIGHGSSTITAVMAYVEVAEYVPIWFRQRSSRIQRIVKQLDDASTTAPDGQTRSPPNNRRSNDLNLKHEQQREESEQMSMEIEVETMEEDLLELKSTYRELMLDLKTLDESSHKRRRMSLEVTKFTARTRG